MERRVFLLEFADKREKLDAVHVVRKDPVGENRLQNRLCGASGSAVHIPGAAVGKAGDSAHIPGGNGGNDGKTLAGVKPDPVDFAKPGNGLFSGERSAGYFKVGKPCVVGVVGDLQNARSEVFRILRHHGERGESAEKLLDADVAQGGTEEAGEHLPIPDQSRIKRLIHGAGLQVLRQEIFVEKTQILWVGVRHVDHRIGEARLKLR